MSFLFCGIRKSFKSVIAKSNIINLTTNEIFCIYIREKYEQSQMKENTSTENALFDLSIKNKAAR
jgi:hypothetical protein